MTSSKISVLTLTSAAIFLTACGSSVQSSGSNGTPTAVSSAVTVAASATSMEVDNATSAQCTSGGSVIILYKDLNANGVYDSASDTLVSASPVCNGATGTAGATGATGATGAQGVGAGVQLTNAPTGTCPAGGTSISTFEDLNNNGVLDIGETITSTSTVCNGVAGTDGLNGASSFITSTTATSAQCSTGGIVYTTRLDGQTPQVNVVCNGLNGANGTNGTNGTNAVFANGPVGPAIAGKVYSACHHDYLYIPDSSGGTRGWLIFRHQANGTADQGVGSTGFNVWNVDITDFDLVSEDNSVTYCQMHWDATAEVLTYLVLDHDDGDFGLSGSIHVSQ
jgi:hypothetical protein